MLNRKKTAALIASFSILVTCLFPVFAGAGTVRVNESREIEIKAGGEHPLDLFGNYTKALMPGETVTFRISVRNESKMPVEMYLKAADTPEDKFPSPEDKAKSDQLLREITMQIDQITGDDTKPLFTGLADGTTGTENAGLREYVHLGLLAAGGETYLALNVTVPITLDNTYQNALGMIDWIFRIDETTEEPTTEPSSEPSSEPSTEPSTNPTTEPSTNPTTEPSTNPTTEPSTNPTTEPSTNPTTEPSTNPTTEPSTNPTTEPSTNPTTEPSSTPTTESTSKPTTSEPTTAKPDEPDVTIVVPPDTGLKEHGWLLAIAGGALAAIVVIFVLPKKKETAVTGN